MTKICISRRHEIKDGKMVNILKDGETIHARMFTMLQNAETGRVQEKYDVASNMDYGDLYVNREQTPL